MSDKVRFTAHTIDVADVEKAARKRGWSPGSSTSPNDYVDAEVYSVSKPVKSSRAGIWHCRRFIKSGRSYFGVETVLREELREDFDGTPRWVVTDRWLISDGGVEEHEANLEAEEAA